MSKRTKENNIGKKCFIITPIGETGSLVFRKAKGVIESVIKPVLEEYGFDDVKPAYEINTSGMINTQIINRIIEDDLVVVNLTGNNPNVMYELCLRHIVAKPIIHICEKGTILPFDIKDSRTIFFQDDMLGADELRESFENFVQELDYEKEYVDNPVYNAYKTGKLLKEYKSSDNNTGDELLAEIYTMLAEMKNDARMNSFQYSDMHEYSQKDFCNDVRNVDIEGIRTASNVNSKMRVHELAKMLNLKSATVLYVAQKAGIELTSAQATLTAYEIHAIIRIILPHI